MTLGPRGPQETAFAPIFEAIHRGLLQRERLLKLDTPLGANTLIPLRALGEAKLGRDYTWTIDAATTRDDLNPDALIAQQSSLSEQHRAESLKAGHDALTELTGATRQPVEPGLSGGRTPGGGTGSANGFKVPAMLLGSASGMGLTTLQSLHASADRHVNVVAGQSAFVATGKSFVTSAGEKVSVFAQDGIKLFAKDAIQIESHRETIDLIGRKTVRIVSATERIEIAADKEILITSGQAYIRLKDGDIQIHAPGKIDIKGSMHSFSGPASMPYPMPTQPDAVCVPCMMKRAAGRSAFVSTGG